MSWLNKIIGNDSNNDTDSSTHRTRESKIRVGKYTSIGNYRDNNEDRLIVDEAAQWYIVADGMGGQAAGEQASQLAVEKIPENLSELPVDVEDSATVKKTVSEAVIAANEAIIEKGSSDPATQNMGTTVVMGVLRGDRLYVAHLGDSRAYGIRDGGIEQLTTDHSLAQALFIAKTITEEEIETHRFKHVLWKYLGSKEAVDGPDIQAFEVASGDRLLLATDGLTGAVDDPTLCKVIQRHDDPQKCAEELVQLALDQGSKDNTTCVVVFFDEI